MSCPLPVAFAPNQSAGPARGYFFLMLPSALNWLT
jgi:hypothetical protein